MPPAGLIEELKAEGEENALFSAIRREGLRRERPLLLETLRALVDGRRVVRCGSVEAPGRQSCRNRYA